MIVAILEVDDLDLEPDARGLDAAVSTTGSGQDVTARLRSSRVIDRRPGDRTLGQAQGVPLSDRPADHIFDKIRAVDLTLAEFEELLDSGEIIEERSLSSGTVRSVS